jgi:RNA polymerase sigma-54 factor
MRLDTSQHLRLDQQMKLAPRIIQAMEILQLPMMALTERIDAELQSNPVLEVREGDGEGDALAREADHDRGEEPMVVSDDNGHSEDFERLSDMEDEYGADLIGDDVPRGPKPAAGERDRKLDAMANTAARGASLNEHLLEQWSFVDVDEPTRRLGEAIINHIDDDGYLRTPLEQIAADLPGATTERLEEVLRFVQTLDPTGVAARDLRECLHLQLRAEAEAGHDVSLEWEIVENHLRNVELNRLPDVARRTGRSLEKIKEALDNLSRLTPKPGLLVGESSVPVIQPDVIVDLDEDGNILVQLGDEHIPQLYIARNYRRMARDRQTESNARKFIQRNIRSAQWLIGAIQQRQETVRRVVGEVFEVQKEFLTQGPEALKPLPMADIAGKIGVHVATISRAVAGKYVQTPRGIYPLRMFFSGGTTTAEGEDMSWDAVKVKLKEVIDNEDKSKPLNDDELAAALNDAGIDIKRRTVAKYRNVMNIPTARRRRQY